jgi:hypothetical protein
MHRGGRAASPPLHRTPSPQRRGRGASRRRPRRVAQGLLAAALLLLALRALLRLSAPAPAPQAVTAAAMRCFVGSSDDGGELATDALPSGHVCSSYRLRCAAADVARGVCSEAEVEAAHTRHVYGMMTTGECEGLAQAAAYHHGRYSLVDCCKDAPLCNGGNHERAGGEAAGRVVRCAAGAHGAVTAVVPADGGRCVRYGAPCAEGAPGCSAADVAAGRLRLVMGSASADACAAYAKQPQAHASLLCCAADMCNDGRAGGFATGEPPGVRRAGAADRATRR